MNYDVSVGDRTLSISVDAVRGGGWMVSVAGGEPRLVTGGAIGAAEWLLSSRGRTHRIAMIARDEGVVMQHQGHKLTVDVVDPRKAALEAAGTAEAGAVVTAMPGAVVRVLVSAGDRVSKGQALVVVEAMKMENEFRSPCDGTVEHIAVSAGDAVDSGALLIVVTPEVGE